MAERFNVAVLVNVLVVLLVLEGGKCEVVWWCGGQRCVVLCASTVLQLVRVELRRSVRR